MRTFTICILLSSVFVACTAITNITVGAILHNDDYETQIALSWAVRKINMFTHDYDMISQRRANKRGITYLPNFQTVSKLDSFKTGKIACDMTESGVAAIFGPESLESTGIVQSICSTMEIPHIQTNWNPAETPYTSTTVLNIHPDPRSLSQMLAELLKASHWKTFTILYQNDDGLIRLQDVLKITKKFSQPITVRQLGDGPDYRPLLKEVEASTVNNIMLDCDTDRIIDILTQAKEVDLLEDYQSYIITSLDTHTLDFDTLFDRNPNVTTMRMVDPNTTEVEQAVADWSMWEEHNSGRRLHMTAKKVLLKTALMYDAVNLFASAVKDLHSADEIKMQTFSCDDNPIETWKYGLRIVEYMKVKRMPNGVTGMIKFDPLGRRTNFTLQVVELSPTNAITGKLTIDDGYTSTRSEGELYTQIVDNIQRKIFKVSSRLGAPYLMDAKPKNGEILTGNARYEGYSMDLIDGISKVLNFSYIFELTPDGRYGSFNKKTKEWDGLIKQLLIRKADLAICDLTITYDRRTAVDFTMPFMTLGVSIIYSKQVKQPPDLFSFTSPLSTDVWLYMATAFLGVTFLMYILARMSPADWENPHPCDQNPEELENAWDLKNCLWFSLGSIMAQGCDILPKAISTRMVSGMWWFFSLILLSSYTANLAAFLTKESMGPKIESAEDLAKQSKIKYGGVMGGSTLSFFKESNFSTYQRMWLAMESARPSVFTKSNQEGVERVLKGKSGYAFLMESTSIEYEMAKNCELTQVGGLLDTKGYGIAMPVNSPYRTAISGAVLKMQEDGSLYLIKEKWWKKMHGVTCDADAKASTDSAAELDLDNVGGVFVVLFGGMGIAFFIALMEFLWNIRKVAVDEQMTLCEALIVELRFAMNVFITRKSAKPKLSESSSDNASDTKSLATSVMRQAGSFLQLNVFNNDINSNSKKS